MPLRAIINMEESIRMYTYVHIDTDPHSIHTPLPGIFGGLREYNRLALSE